MNEHQPQFCTIDPEKSAPKAQETPNENKPTWFKRILSWLIKGAEANAAGCSS